MSFQWIIDNAEAISINRKKVVASSTARDGTTRAVSRGGQVWIFSVKLPDGISWTTLRPLISQAESLDRIGTANISLNATGQRWLSGYQGNSANYTGFVGSITQGSQTLTLTTSPTTTSGFKFKAGDFIQIQGGKVYTVADNVPYNSNSVLLHRPVLEGTSTGNGLNVAENCVFNVICTQFPNWSLFAKDQVAWDGEFVFTEVL